jgi:hypothetical protein
VKSKTRECLAAADVTMTNGNAGEDLLRGNSVISDKVYELIDAINDCSKNMTVLFK